MKVFLKSRYPALGSRDYRLQFIGQCISNAGTQMTNVGLAWHIYELTGSPFMLALLGASRVLPIVVFSLISGALVDAHNRKKIIYVSQICQSLGALLLALLTISGNANPLNILI